MYNMYKYNVVIYTKYKPECSVIQPRPSIPQTGIPAINIHTLNNIHK